MWFVPAIGIVGGWVVVGILARFERTMGWEMQISGETAQAVMSTMVASMFSLVVVVCSALLVAVQLASAQLTPRIITFIYRSRVRKLSLGVFAFTFTFSLSFLSRMEAAVPLVSSYLAAAGFLLDL